MSHFITHPYFVDHRSVAPYGGSDTQFVASYSISQLTEPDDVEYDPTPYGGGYDLELTYGKPLPPSDEICHPRTRSLPAPNPIPNSQIESSVDLPKWKEPQIAQEEAAPEQPPQEIQPQSQPPSDDDVGGDNDIVGDDSGAIVAYGKDNYNNYPWGGGYDCDRNVGESPFGCNPDAMDFCESLFGYWPCLHRKQPESYGPDAEAVAPDYASWDSRSAADYLFGDSKNGEFGSQLHSSCS